MPQFTIIDMKRDGSVYLLLDEDLPDIILSSLHINQTKLYVNSALLFFYDKTGSTGFNDII